MGPGQSPVQDAPDPRRWKALLICMVGGFMVLLDVSIVNVALPSIRTGLDAPPSDLQWIVSGYALTFGLLLVPAGRVGDVRGRRDVFVAALGLFTLASVSCGVARSSTWLVVARLFQGAAGGLLTPQISALIQELFHGRERGKAFGIFGSVVGISTAVGPLLGGVLIQIFGRTEGWRFVFFVNLPVGLIAMPVAWRLVPHRVGRRKQRDYDVCGVVLLGLSVVLVLLPLVEERQWPGDAKWLLVLAAAILAGLFMWWERRYRRGGHEPVVDLALFGRRSYTLGMSLMTAYFAGFTPLFFVFTLYLQTGLHYSALQAGIAMTPFAIGSAATAALAGRAVHRFGRPLVALGLVVVGAGFALSILAVDIVPSHGTGWATAGPLLLAGMGSGMVIAPNQTLTLSQVPVRHAGSAGGMLQTGQRIGAAVGIAAVGSAFFARVAATHGRGFAGAFRHGLLLTLGFVAVALVAALVDQVLQGRRAHRSDHAASAGAARRNDDL